MGACRYRRKLVASENDYQKMLFFTSVKRRSKMKRFSAVRDFMRRAQFVPPIAVALASFEQAAKEQRDNLLLIARAKKAREHGA